MEAAHYSFSEWTVVLNETFLPMDMKVVDDASFTATMRAKTVNGIRILDIAAGPHIASRSLRTLAKDDLRFFCITQQLEGMSSVTQDGTESILGPGDFAIFDSTRPFERRFDGDYRCLTLRFPHYMISIPPHALARLTATRFAADDGLGVIVSPYLAEVARNLGELHGWYGVLVAQTMIDLVSAALGEKLAQVDPGAQGGHTDVFLSGCDYIVQNLSDPELTPESIAAACFVSVRLLHKIFHAEHTTVSQWIRSRRLEQCRRQLSDPHDADRSIGEIAAAAGIHDGAHFSRLFRAAFGTSPREYRKTQLDLIGSDPLWH
jgi:AraC-like DNA-binding protein